MAGRERESRESDRRPTPPRARARAPTDLGRLPVPAATPLAMVADLEFRRKTFEPARRSFGRFRTRFSLVSQVSQRPV